MSIAAEPISTGAHYTGTSRTRNTGGQEHTWKLLIVQKSS
jgi:hypothetical protein